MDKKKLINSHLAQARVMQLATAMSNQPWVCTVHFASDDELNLYWTSKIERRHSMEIAKNNKVSAAIPIEDNQKDGYVIGLSFEGVAKVLSGKQQELAHERSLRGFAHVGVRLVG